jgi:hypothetical protein
MPFAFITMPPIYSPTSRKTTRKKKHKKRARFDGEITATVEGNGMVGKQRDPVKDSYYDHKNGGTLGKS